MPRCPAGADLVLFDSRLWKADAYYHRVAFLSDNARHVMFLKIKMPVDQFRCASGNAPNKSPFWGRRAPAQVRCRKPPRVKESGRYAIAAENNRFFEHGEFLQPRLFSHHFLLSIPAEEGPAIFNFSFPIFCGSSQLETHFVSEAFSVVFFLLLTSSSTAQEILRPNFGLGRLAFTESNHPSHTIVCISELRHLLETPFCLILYK